MFGQTSKEIVTCSILSSSNGYRRAHR